MPGLSCWDQGDRGVLIMGYIEDGRTTDLVSVDGSTSSPSFQLKHKITHGCGIDLGDFYILSGGMVRTGSAWVAINKVSNYSTTGWKEDLPGDLNTARSYHACSFYATESGDKVLLVTGGRDTVGNDLSSTEIYRNKAWTVLPSAALPSPAFLLSAGNIDNTIFVFGGYGMMRILKFNPRTEKWEDVGSFSRSGHAMQVVDDAEKYC